jgi:hypothetical protein
MPRWSGNRAIAEIAGRFVGSPSGANPPITDVGKCVTAGGISGGQEGKPKSHVAVGVAPPGARSTVLGFLPQRPKSTGSKQPWVATPPLGANPQSTVRVKVAVCCMLTEAEADAVTVSV